MSHDERPDGWDELSLLDRIRWNREHGHPLALNINGEVVENWDEYPDECQHCGAGASVSWVPADWAPGDSCGTCTECGQPFAT